MQTDHFCTIMAVKTRVPPLENACKGSHLLTLRVGYTISSSPSALVIERVRSSSTGDRKMASANRMKE